PHRCPVPPQLRRRSALQELPPPKWRTTPSSPFSPGPNREGNAPARSGARLTTCPLPPRLRGRSAGQEPSPTPWGTKPSSPLSPGAERGGKGPAARRVGGDPHGSGKARFTHKVLDSGFRLPTPRAPLPWPHGHSRRSTFRTPLAGTRRPHRHCGGGIHAFLLGRFA